MVSKTYQNHNQYDTNVIHVMICYRVAYTMSASLHLITKNKRLVGVSLILVAGHNNYIWQSIIGRKYRYTCNIKRIISAHVCTVWDGCDVDVMCIVWGWVCGCAMYMMWVCVSVWVICMCMRAMNIRKAYDSYYWCGFINMCGEPKSNQECCVVDAITL